MKNKTNKLLYKAHLLINAATGTDIPKYKLEEAQREARKIYKEIRDLDPKIYNILKEDL